MEEMTKYDDVGHAAMMAGMDRKTARKHVQAGRLPSEMVAPRTWSTREDPFVKDWEEIERLLTDTPEFEAKTLFAVLTEKYPGRYEPGQLRTLQRHVKRWRAERGPDKEVGRRCACRSRWQRFDEACKRPCSSSVACRNTTRRTIRRRRPTGSRMASLCWPCEASDRSTKSTSP